MSYLGAFPSATSEAVDPEEQAPPDLRADLHEDSRTWPSWVGVLPYEAFRHGERRRAQPGAAKKRDEHRAPPHFTVPKWHRYDAVVGIWGEHAVVQGSSREAVERLAKLLGAQSPSNFLRPTLTLAEEPESADLHKARIERALDCISRGELYQVNLARRFRFLCRGHPFHLLGALGPAASAPFSAAFDLGDRQVVSTSPELFLEWIPGGPLRTRPVKGTRPRSEEPIEDARLARELDESEKERAELAMVIDIERNDLGRIAEVGSVRMSVGPHVVAHPTVHHREAVVEARLLPEVTRAQLLDVMMPSGSITGAPKVAAMDLICELELHRRGLYTGALGYLRHDGGLKLSMAIRVLSMKAGEAHYFAGGGIVADSDPEQEFQETLWKAEQLRSLVQIQA